MRTIRLIPAAAIVIAGTLAGCGSASKSSSSAASTPPPSSTTQTSSTPAATGTTPSAATPVVVTTKHNPKLGTILGAGPKHLTVYLFEGDKAGASNCTGACASVWPPVTGKGQVAGAAMSADLGTITRPDGTTQVTYKRHPLYFCIKDIKDGDAGDTYSEAIKSLGAEWYALAPTGKKVDLS